MSCIGREVTLFFFLTLFEDLLLHETITAETHAVNCVPVNSLDVKLQLYAFSYIFFVFPLKKFIQFKFVFSVMQGYALLCVGFPSSDLEVETQDEDEVR
jgi:hypothetical protein